MVFAQLEVVDTDDDLVDRAAEQSALRAYDAVHLAAAKGIFDADLVVVPGDQP